MSQKHVILACLSLLAGASLVRAQEVAADRATPSQKARFEEVLGADRSWADGKQDPPGVLNEMKIDSVRQLAMGLSSSRNWLRDDVLKALDRMGVRIDEIFAEAPEFVEVDHRFYRLVLEKVGAGWQGFKPDSSAYLIFVDHDTFDGYGENFALAFQDGKERMIVKEDIEKTAAIGLSLKETMPSERPARGARVVGLDQSIRLGKVATRFRSTSLLNIRANSETCLPESAPTSCSGGVPVCSSPNASPYFVLTSALIKTDHEDAFSGNPEIEIYPLRVNPSSPYGGSSDVRTNWIFDGRTVADLAGRSRYLPDINNNYTWYSISGGGLALFPSQASNEWVATMIEDDDTKGRLKIERTKYNPFKKRDYTIVPVYSFDFFDLWKFGLGFILSLDILNDSDDLYVQSLEVSNNTFCSEALGQYFPYTLLFDSSEWSLQGYFACIDPTCVPDPCAGDPCCGDPCCGDPYCGGGGGCGNQICP
ncbi:MAG: hypothetical protein ABUT39_09105 [Acidobacteriota bacterium]